MTSQYYGRANRPNTTGPLSTTKGPLPCARQPSDAGPPLKPPQIRRRVNRQPHKEEHTPANDRSARPPQPALGTRGPRPMDKLLTVAEAAEQLGTTERFPRRLIAERRIRFVKVGRHVRIPTNALNEYIEAQTVEPMPAAWSERRAA